MPPPMKNAITNEHEELLWNNKLLSTDTSIGLIQAVIFYLIKCFGLWQGRDLKLLKTEHVTFSEDEIGKFVAIDLKKALGSGRVIKRYDDHGNPRSVYKIMKTYKGYLANEGPFLVRPISSIKDYICYSPWPVGLTILEQTVVNIMQDCGIGPGFGNVSVCLLSIDTLRSFGTGGHCISTWFSRLYPKYKKTFWAEAFRECSEMNCEDKNQEMCLMISHLLDPPYPATKMLSEMKKHQEMMKNKAQRSSMFTSWLSNLNSTTEDTVDADTAGTRCRLQEPKANNKRKITIKTAATSKDKPQSRRKGTKHNLRHNASGYDTSTTPSQLSTVSSSTPSSLRVSSNITVKTEILTDCESSEMNSKTSDMKIMAVLSIPESAFSAQVDEAECTADDIVENMTPTHQTPEQKETEKTSNDSHSKGVSCFKRKLNHSKDDDTDSTLGTKQTKVYKHEIVECKAEKNDSVTEGSQIGETAMESDIVSLCAEVKVELDIECESSTDMVSNGSDVTTQYSENSQVHSANRERISAGHQDTNNIMKRDQSESCPDDSSLHVYPSSSEVETPNLCVDHSVPAGLESEVPVEHQLEAPSPCASEAGHFMPESLLPSLSLANPSSSTSVLMATTTTTLSNTNKDSIKILRKLLHKEGQVDAVSADLENGSKTLQGETSRHSLSCKTLWETTCTEDTCSSPRQEAEATGQEDSHTTQHRRVGSECHSTNKSNVSNSNTNATHLAASAELECTRPVNEIQNLSTIKNQTCFPSNSQTSTDIVKFLDAANQQLQNILQVSSAGTKQGNETAQHSSTSGINPGHLNQEKSSRLSSQPYKLMNKDNGQHQLHLQHPSPRCDSSSSSADLLSSSSSSEHCHSSNAISVTSVSETQNVYESNQNTSCPFLRSVVVEPSGPGTKAGKAPVRSSLHGWTLKARSVLKKKPARLKAPLTTRVHKVKGYCCRCRNKPVPRPKTGLPFRKISHIKTDNTGSSHGQGQTNSADNYSTSVRSSLHSSDPHLFPNPSSSLLTEATVGSSSNSGFYYYRSDHHENAAYQKVKINKENNKSQTFTISDLPLDVPGSSRQEDCIDSPASEICLGDYFPEGTVLPMKDVKLLTRQSSSGLEVVLKFEYRVSKNDTETVHQTHKNKLQDCTE